MAETPEERMLAVSRVSLFEGLKSDNNAMLELCRIMDTQDYVAGHTLINEGAMGDELFILVEGQVSVYRKTPDGDPYKVAILKGEMTPALGEGGLVASEARSATVKVDGPSKCLVLHRSEFEKFAQVHPEWAIPILKKIATIVMSRLKQVNYDLMLLHKALMDEIRG